MTDNERKELLTKFSALVEMSDALIMHYRKRFKEDGEIGVAEMLFAFETISDKFSEVFNECYPLMLIKEGKDENEQ